MWIITCQKCGNKQVMPRPEECKEDRWKLAKCRRCWGPLDYGCEAMEINDAT
jgi:hypothetical protein